MYLSPTTKKIALLGGLTGLLAAVAYFVYKEMKNERQTVPKQSSGALNGLGVGKSYTFPRNSNPQDPSFVKEV